MRATRQTLVELLILDSLVLDECSVVRGEAENAEPGRVENEINVSVMRDDKLAFVVESTHSFMNVDGALVVRVTSTYTASYSYEGPDPDPEEIEDYAQNALMIQVLPFIREFLASMTNRLGLPPFYLPLLGNRAVAMSKAKSAIRS